MFVFLKALCARLFMSAVQIVEHVQTVFRHINTVGYSTQTSCVLQILLKPRVSDLAFSEILQHLMWVGQSKLHKNQSKNTQKCPWALSGIALSFLAPEWTKTIHCVFLLLVGPDEMATYELMLLRFETSA